jgi:hypothetical protein
MLRLGGRIPPRALFISGCVAIAALSFWSTLMLLDRSEAPSSWPDPIVTALPAGTPQTSLADLPALPDSRFSWLGISGINARVISGVPAVSGHPILRLVALGDGIHTLAFRVNGLIKNERYRLTAWINLKQEQILELQPVIRLRRTTGQIMRVRISTLQAEGFCRPTETENRASNRLELG